MCHVIFLIVAVPHPTTMSSSSLNLSIPEKREVGVAPSIEEMDGGQQSIIFNLSSKIKIHRASHCSFFHVAIALWILSLFFKRADISNI